MSIVLHNNHINLSRPLVPLYGEIHIRAHRLFCTKFNFELSFETFLKNAYFWQR